MTTTVRWYGQSAFLIAADTKVFVDPFGDVSAALAERGLKFDYPPIAGVEADLVLVTHEHLDHNGVAAIGGDPAVLRSTAGRLQSPVGEVVAVASEHDDHAGTVAGPNTIFCFGVDGLRFCHMGDFGQRGLRPEQRAAMGDIDVLFVPVGGGPTIGDATAADVVRSVGPRVVVPMHYRTPAVDFLDEPDAFLDALGAPVTRVDGSEVDVESVLGSADAPNVALFAPPGA
jgi:L-ascorbate metabolism protein UlaG (beta-lactamase superfamily)